MKIGWTVEKLLLGVNFSKNSPGAPLEWNFQYFDVFELFRLLSWIDRYTICKNRLNGWKVIEGGIFSWKFPGCSPRVKFETFLMFLYFSACQAKSIGILIMKIGWTVKKLLLGVNFFEKFPGCSPGIKFSLFWCFYFVSLVKLNRSVCYL